VIATVLSQVPAPGEFQAPEVDWFAVAPVALVLGAGVVGVLVEAFAPRAARRPIQLGLVLASLVGAFVFLVLLWDEPRGALGGALVLDRPALFLQGTIVALSVLAVLTVAERGGGDTDAFAPQASAVPGSVYEDAARRAGLAQTEVFPLMLFAVGGMMVFSSAGDLLTMFVALEVFSLPLYIMCGLARRRRLLSQEASLKYFLLGAFSSAIFLYGIALLYGVTGTVQLAVMRQALVPEAGELAIVVVGVVLLLTGLLFKVSAVPFHAWTPDVYTGAPTPITGFMAACTKVAAFGALLRVLYVGLPQLADTWEPAVLAIAVVTMVVGSVVAISQTDVKRMLAYSSIAHAGFILTGVVAIEGISAVLFYLIAYGLSTIGAFAVVTLVRERDVAGGITGEATHLSQWAGLGRRSPLLAATFTLFLLAFAGIPLTSGFPAKFGVFQAAVVGGHAWLAVVGVLASAVAAFFYVRVIVLMYFTSSPQEQTTVASASPLSAVVIAVGAAATVVLGVLPAPLLELAATAATAPVP
jgi:NADH-quinone oxidoreductase subunit N